jgi:hypothetical protein
MFGPVSMILLMAAEAVEPAPAPTEPVTYTQGQHRSARRHRTVTQWPDTRFFSRVINVGVGGRWGHRTVDSDTETGGILLGTLGARFVGYASHRPLIGGGRRFITPELFVTVGSGANVSSQLRVIGTDGILRVGIGRSLATRVSPYASLQFDSRFAGYLRDTAEGNFITVAARGSAGLLARTRDESFVLLAGGSFDAVGGAQRLGSRTAIAQAMPGAQLSIYSQLAEDRAFMLLGDVRSTLFGQHNGGQRLEGRGALELLFGGADSGAFSALLTYSGTKIQFDAPAEGGATRREVRVGHALLLSFGMWL